MKLSLLAILSAPVLAACNATGSLAVATDFELDGATFSLTDANGKCRISRSDAEAADLNIPYPCSVHTELDGTVRTIDERGKTYFLIESSRPDADTPGDCVTQIQAVRLDDTGMSISDYSDNVASCPPFQWDRQMFVGLFED